MLPIRKPLWQLLTLLGVAIGYAASGWAGLLFAIPPNYASPLYPAAGFALAVLLSWGYRMAPGVALGAFIINVLLSQERGQPALPSAALIAAGATLQAVLGAWLTRRFVSRPLLLSEPRDLALFYLLSAGLACCISPSIGVLALIGSSAVPAAAWGSAWGTWWIGDTAGVLIATPLVLSLVGRPRSVWRKRRLSVALPMLIATLLLGLTTRAVSEWDEQRRIGAFEREADNAAHAVDSVLREPLMALEATHGLLLVAPQLSRQAFERGTASHVMPGGHLLALGLARRVPRDRLSTFNREAQAEGFTDYQARDRQRGDDIQPPADEDMLAIRLIEPLSRNAPALGINILSIRDPRTAIARASASGLITATAGFELSQDNGGTTGVVIYQAIYDGLPGTVAERMSALRGMVFVTLRPDQMLQAVSNASPSALELCLVDTDPQASRRRLAGPVGCEATRTDRAFKLRSINFAGRDWDLRVFAPSESLQVTDTQGLPFALIGLMCSALLGSLLLLVTGRTHRIETLVLARTAELKREAAERERGALALRESEQRFRNIFETAPIGVLFADLHGRLQEANPYICRLLGYSAAELTAMRTSDFSHPDDRAEDARLGLMLLRGEVGTYLRHKRYIARDGREVWARARATLLRDGRGEPSRVVGVVEDITEQMRLQDLEKARESAVAANQAKSEFLSRMSHELRTPLNAMLGFSQLLEVDRSPPLSAGQRARVAQIQQAGWHLLEMINDTLDLSRIEAGGLRLASEALNLDTLATDTLGMLAGEANKRGLQMKLALGADAREVQGDSTRVKQILINLLSNAIKYNRQGGTVEVSSQLSGSDLVEIKVRDSGAGLSEAQLAQLFQPFNRLGQEQSSIEGTGIGLVISRRLAELMGGSLRAESRVGEGSTFVLSLPQALTAVQAAAPATPGGRIHYAGPRRVIYIEDNAVNAALMQGILAQRPDIGLEIYPTASEGLAAVAERLPDLVLLDMQLPDLDGLSALRQLRAGVRTAKVPVIMVSANALPEQIEACRLAGAQHYLTKPIDVPGLLAIVDAALI